MVRMTIATVVLLFASAALQAAELRGTIKSVAADKGQVVLMVGDKEMTVQLTKEAKVYGTFVTGRIFRRTAIMELSNGLSALTPSTPVVVTTEMREGREWATQIQLEGMQRRLR